jgi:hypothetical protein
MRPKLAQFGPGWQLQCVGLDCGLQVMHTDYPSVANSRAIIGPAWLVEGLIGFPDVCVSQHLAACYPLMKAVVSLKDGPA